MRFALVLIALVIGCDKPPPRGPGNSTVPCAENCGNDPNCNKNCAPVGTQPPGTPPIR
jgi:hypothetical protein